MDKQGTRNKYPGIDKFAVELSSLKAFQLIRKSRLFRYEDFPDLQQDMLMAYSRYIDRWNPERTNREAYIQVIIQNAARQLIKTAKRQKNDSDIKFVVIDDPIIHGDDITYADVIPDTQHIWQNPMRKYNARAIQERIDNQKLVKGMPRDLLRLTNQLLVKSQTKVARELGVSQSALSIKNQELMAYVNNFRNKA